MTKLIRPFIQQHCEAGQRVEPGSELRLSPTEVVLRPIERADNEQVAHIIRSVMTELGFGGPGYSSSDAEVSMMYEVYNEPRSAYFVLSHGTRLLGGGGVAPLAGGDAGVCELKKMYFLPEIRGLGLGRKVLELCLVTARRLDFQYCYLETMLSMESAGYLYTQLGFKRVPAQLGATGHSAPDAYYLLRL